MQEKEHTEAATSRVECRWPDTPARMHIHTQTHTHAHTLSVPKFHSPPLESGMPICLNSVGVEI